MPIDLSQYSNTLYPQTDAQAASPAEETIPQPLPLDQVDQTSWGKREDGSSKGTGFLGVLPRPDGGVSTEISVGVEVGGKEMDVPTLVPTLTPKEVNYLLNTDENSFLKDNSDMANTIIQKATDFAKQRIAQGKSVWAQPDEGPYASKGGK